MKAAAMIFGLALVGSQAARPGADPDLRPDGRSLGTAAADGQVESTLSHALLMSGSVANLLYFARV